MKLINRKKGKSGINTIKYKERDKLKDIAIKFNNKSIKTKKKIHLLQNLNNSLKTIKLLKNLKTINA